MKPFSKKEILTTSFILAIIISLSLYNFGIAKRRGRDAQRKNDIGSITDALNKYANDFAVYPAESGGKIVACQGEQIWDEVQGRTIFTFRPCEWGQDSLRDVNDPSYPPYLRTIPIEPQSKEGLTYTYLSNGKRFQILASLEGKDEDEYDSAIEDRRITCGARICNFGRSSGKTPLDRSIEEYENELEEESKVKI